LTVLQDGRVWKRHVDHLTRRQIKPLQNIPETANEVINLPVTAASETAVSPTPLPNQDQSTSTDNEQHSSGNTQGSIELPNMTESNTVRDTEHFNEPANDESVSLQVSVPPTTCRRSSRIVKPPDRLIETMS